MLLNYGHACINWEGEQYMLTPSFANIAKLGTPKEIIDTFKTFISPGTKAITKFAIALKVLNSCSDKAIPEELTGSVHLSVTRGRLYKMPKHDLPMFEDCITLAEHCLRHGICGAVEPDIGEAPAKPVQEFDAYSFMEMARIHLDLSRDDAANVTMTEFARMMQAKFPSDQKKQEPAKNEFDDLIAWGEEQDKRAH